MGDLIKGIILLLSRYYVLKELDFDNLHFEVKEHRFDSASNKLVFAIRLKQCLVANPEPIFWFSIDGFQAEIKRLRMLWGKGAEEINIELCTDSKTLAVKKGEAIILTFDLSPFYQCDDAADIILEALAEVLKLDYSFLTSD